MTESTKSGETPQVKDNKEAYKMERQKSKVLKNAIKDEKKQKQMLEQDLKLSLEKHEQL